MASCSNFTIAILTNWIVSAFLLTWIRLSSSSLPKWYQHEIKSVSFLVLQIICTKELPVVLEFSSQIEEKVSRESGTILFEYMKNHFVINSTFILFSCVFTRIKICYRKILYLFFILSSFAKKSALSDLFSFIQGFSGRYLAIYTF